MNQHYWALLIIIGIWLGMVIISGTLALIYQLNHTPYQKQRLAYLKSWRVYKINHQQNPYSPLTPNFPLPHGEELYYFDQNITLYLYQKKSQEYKFILKTEGDQPVLAMNKIQNDDYLSLRSGFTLGLHPGPKPKFKGEIFLTNRRLILSDSAARTKMELTLKEIKKAYIALIYEQKKYTRGYVLQTEKEIYEITSSRPEIVLILNTLLQKSIFPSPNLGHSESERN